MSRLRGIRRRWLLIILTLLLVTLTGHLIAEAANPASVANSRPDAGVPLSSGCLHGNVLLPVFSALPSSFIPRFVLSPALPILHGYCAPTPLRPPISTRSH